MDKKIYAVDFDGTLCESMYPAIGDPKAEVVKYVRRKKAEGHKIILWTNRVGERLDEAVVWCKERGLEFDAINENLPEIIEAFGVDTRKVFANYYIDDRNLLWKF